MSASDTCEVAVDLREEAAATKSPTSGITHLISRVRAGDDAAIDELLRRYAPVVEREIRMAMVDVQLRRLISESDICQSVLIQLWKALRAGRYAIDTHRDFVGLLRVIVRAQVVDLVRYWTADRRNVYRNIALRQACSASRKVTPSRQASAKELLKQAYCRMDVRQQRIVKLRLDGATWAEVAERFDAASAEAVRKEHQRALAKVARDLDIDSI